MIPNCAGCEEELNEACEWQNKGYNILLEGMGETRHLFLMVLDDKGNIILE
jgi:hypothetical protein